VAIRPAHMGSIPLHVLMCCDGCCVSRDWYAKSVCLDGRVYVQVASTFFQSLHFTNQENRIRGCVLEYRKRRTAQLDLL